MEKKMGKKKDDILSILLAFMVEKDTDDGVININSLYFTANKLVQFADTIEFLKDYDYPDLSMQALKKNKFVKRVALNGDVYYAMTYDEAVDIIRNNMDIILTIQNFAIIDYFSEKLSKIESGEFTYNPKNSDDVYSLYDSYAGLQHEKSRLYTNGIVTEIECDEEGNPQYKVENSSYTILTEEVNNKIVYGCVTSSYYDLNFLDNVYDELMCVIKGIGAYQNKDNKVYLKRRS